MFNSTIREIGSIGRSAQPLPFHNERTERQDRCKAKTNDPLQIPLQFSEQRQGQYPIGYEENAMRPPHVFHEQGHIPNVFQWHRDPKQDQIAPSFCNCHSAEPANYRVVLHAAEDIIFRSAIGFLHELWLYAFWIYGRKCTNKTVSNIYFRCRRVAYGRSCRGIDV